VIFWLDVHLKPELALLLKREFSVDAIAVRDLGLRDATDRQIFERGRQLGNLVVVIKDGDFVELVYRLRPPPEVLWLTVGNLTTAELKTVLHKTLNQAIADLCSGSPVFEISR